MRHDARITPEPSDRATSSGIVKPEFGPGRTFVGTGQDPWISWSRTMEADQDPGTAQTNRHRPPRMRRSMP